MLIGTREAKRIVDAYGLGWGYRRVLRLIKKHGDKYGRSWQCEEFFVRRDAQTAHYYAKRAIAQFHKILAAQDSSGIEYNVGAVDSPKQTATSTKFTRFLPLTTIPTHDGA